MTKLKPLFIILMLLSSALCMDAEPTVVISKKDKQATPVPVKDSNKLKPNDGLGIDLDVECQYQDGVLHFSFRRSEGKVTTSVIHAESGREYTMTALSLCPFSISVGEHPGYYLITLTTAKGNHYTGEYIIEE